jgi:hypothetical protein
MEDGPRTAAITAPFASSGLDHRFAQNRDRRSTKVRRYGAQTPRITPTEKWLLEGSRGSHLMGTLSFYEMWKNHENDNPVTVVLLDRDNNPYITVKDTQNGPHVTVASRGQQAGQP